jgi:hypothetical protein
MHAERDQLPGATHAVFGTPVAACVRLDHRRTGGRGSYAVRRNVFHIYTHFAELEYSI